jgi:hypothetical protein
MVFRPHRVKQRKSELIPQFSVFRPQKVATHIDGGETSSGGRS